MKKVKGSPNTPRTLDAVVVVPGIMGSELVDAEGKVVWGLRPGVLARAWSGAWSGGWSGGGLDRLTPTEDELDGHPRLQASRLLRLPGYIPGLGGVEPYTKMIETVKAVATDPRAVLEFPYDWRLPIDRAAADLVAKAEAHLARWRDVVAQEKLGDREEVRLSVVAHSMGGLVTAYAARVLGLNAVLGRVITAGTPYFGAVKAVRLLESGRGAPTLVPRRAARELARRCPGVYDLLPRYRCVDLVGKSRVGTAEAAAAVGADSQPARDARDRLRALTPEDVAAVGVDPEPPRDAWDRPRALTPEEVAELARGAEDRWRKIGLGESGRLPGWLPILGKMQPTDQSLTITAGECDYLQTLGGLDYSGDSTVYRDAAAPIGLEPVALPQKHGALMRAPEVRTLVADRLVGRTTGPPLGTRPVGADIPDIGVAGTPVVVTVSSTDGDPYGVTVSSTDLDRGTTITWHPGVRDGERARFPSPLLRPGLHRVEVKAGGFSPVSDIVLVAQGES